MRAISTYLFAAALVVLSAASAFCVFMLFGLYLYSGTLLPSTGSDGMEGIALWLEWGAIVATPLLTAALWVWFGRLRRKMP